jgi:hypothetical protein
MKPLLAAFLAACLCACASYDGRGLVPGQSTAQDVERLMGRPAEKVSAANGETVWFHPRAPEGRHTYAVRLDPDGKLIAIEQRLTSENFAKVVPGRTAAKEVRELLGPPWNITRYPFKEGEVWDYRVKVEMRLFDFLVELSQDGVVQKAYLLHDPIYDAPSGRN